MSHTEPNKMNKKIKFALILKNDEEVRTMSDLKKFFDIREVMDSFFDGKLERWLADHYYFDKAEKISELRNRYKDKSNSTENLTEKAVEVIQEIFDIPPAERKKLNQDDIEDIIRLSKKEDELVQNIVDKNALKNIHLVAENQAELEKLIKKNHNKMVSIYILNDGANPYTLNAKYIERTKLRFVGVETKNSRLKTKINIVGKIFSDYDERDVEKFFYAYKNRFSNVTFMMKIDLDKGDDAENFFTENIPKSAAQGNYLQKGETNSVEEVQDKLIRYMDAGFPLIYLNTFEEDKADEIIKDATSDRKIFEWNTETFSARFNGKHTIFKEGWSLNDVLEHLIRVQTARQTQIKADEDKPELQYNLERSVLVLKDAHGFLRKDAHSYFHDDKVVSHLKFLAHMIYNGQLEDCNIIIVSPVLSIPKELENYLTIINLGNLTEAEIKKLVIDFCKNHDANIPDEDFCDDLVTALKGLSEFEIINILSLALSGNNELKRSDINLILDQKKQMIQKLNILEMIDAKEKLEDIGGLENLKDWLKRKAKIFNSIKAAQNFGVQIPKGILIVGMPGCGKSLSAKATAKTFDMPLLKMDMGRIMGKYVGESETNMRRALKLSEEIAPCVLWIDELEKAFSGIGGGGGSGEVTTRLFGTFLTWMQEKTQAVFVVATANDVSSLPPELLRKGRFDEIFYIGLPNSAERRKIFEIYFNKIPTRDVDGLTKNLDEFVASTRNYSGADIEGVVKEAVELAFIEKIEQKNNSPAETSTETTETKGVNLTKKFQGLSANHVKMAIAQSYSISQAQSNVIDELKKKKFKNASKADESEDLYDALGYHFGIMKHNATKVWKAVRNKKPGEENINNSTKFLGKVKTIFSKKKNSQEVSQDVETQTK